MACENILYMNIVHTHVCTLYIHVCTLYIHVTYIYVHVYTHVAVIPECTFYTHVLHDVVMWGTLGLQCMYTHCQK